MSRVVPHSGVSKQAFSLIELLVVIGIIGLLASLALPAIRGIGRANAITGANRQILDDLALARLRAINGRTTVYLAFYPVTNLQAVINSAANATDKKRIQRLINAQYTGYALISRRSVGDQPGRDSSRYVSEWKFMPDGTLIAPYKFQNSPTLDNPYDRGFAITNLPFPVTYGTLTPLRCIAFNAKGQLISGRDEIIPIAQGSILFQRDNNNELLVASGDVVITPPGNFTNNYIRVNWLTGRANIEAPQF